MLDVLTDTPATTTDEVRLAGLRKSFGDVLAVADVDLSISRGQTIALLGLNGAGKSTTIDLLLGLGAPDEGAVTIFGRSPQEAVADGRLGVMLQIGQVLRDVTVRELVSMMASLFPRPLAVNEAIELAGLAEIADRRTNKLSGGEMQKVRFALALVPDPELLVLDEPTVAMDVEARQGFWTTMRAFAARGKTVVFATHYLEEADAYADRIVLMARGSVVADGSTSEIKSLVGSRHIAATLPGARVDDLTSLPGVQHAEVHGSTISLTCTDSDATLRALLVRHPGARDIEVVGAGLEQAFLQLTADRPPDGRTPGAPHGEVDR
jgi:ABC-2 type transport system ATP-binding protein